MRSDPAAQAQAAHVVALLARQPGFQRALDYPATHLPVLVSRNGRETLVLAAFATRERSAQAVEHIRPQLAGSGVRLGGNDVAFNEINKRTSSDLARAEMFALPILLLLSFWVFRGLIAAALPLLVGGFAIVITFLALRLIDQFAGLSVFAVNLVTGIGLGLGIDYSLFILSRYREELARGLDTHAAIRRTLQTAGRTVLFGSLTVAGALASMLVFPLRFLYSMGIGGAIVTLSAGAVSLIVLPGRARRARTAHQRAGARAPAAQRRAGRAPGRERRLVSPRARCHAPSRAWSLLGTVDRADRDCAARAAPAADPGRRPRAAHLGAAPPGGRSDHPRLRRGRLADGDARRARAPQSGSGARSPRSRTARRPSPAPRRASPGAPRYLGAGDVGDRNAARGARTARPPTSG